MAKANRICKTCGKAYFFCSNCDKTLNSPQWMLMWHDENCMNVFEIVSDYAQRHITKSEAKRKLEKCNLKVEYTFKDSIRALCEEIMAEEKVEKVEKVENPTKTENQSFTRNSKRNRDKSRK